MVLRIIGGTTKGKRLRSASSQIVRPASVRMRQSLFSILQAEPPSAEVLDLFAGIGSLGLEALSRGAASCVFVESHPVCIEVLRKNVSELGFDGESKVVRADALVLLKAFETSGESFSLTFVDPPYAMTDDSKSSARIFRSLERAAARRVFREGSLVVVRKRKKAPAPEQLEHLEMEASRTYSHAEVLFFRARLSS